MTASVPAQSVPLQRTPFYPFHQARGAHFVPYAGWEMPLYYGSLLAEHDAVRHRVGIFDVSHMGILTVVGGHAAPLLSRRTTANVTRLEPGQCRYSFFLDASGAIVDDLLVTRLDDGESPAPAFLVVPNASRTDLILDLLRQHRRPDTMIRRWNGEVGILAVQGPTSKELLTQTLALDLEGLGFYRTRLFPTSPGSDGGRRDWGEKFAEIVKSGTLLGRTGYTGELGYELYIPADRAVEVADRLATAGATPCGLGARDLLRLEKGYLLSGQEFNRDHTPLEAGQEKFVDFDHEFVGAGVLENQRKEGVKVRLAGLVLTTPGAIPRHGSRVLKDAQLVGAVTSGSLSPMLQRGIALAYLRSELATPGTEVAVEVRGLPSPATVVKLPFVPSGAR